MKLMGRIGHGRLPTNDRHVYVLEGDFSVVKTKLIRAIYQSPVDPECKVLLGWTLDNRGLWQAIIDAWDRDISRLDAEEYAERRAGREYSARTLVKGLENAALRIAGVPRRKDIVPAPSLWEDSLWWFLSVSISRLVTLYWITDTSTRGYAVGEDETSTRQVHLHSVSEDSHDGEDDSAKADKDVAASSRTFEDTVQVTVTSC